MIFGILPNSSNTETCLNNLAEAEFDLAQVSVIMRDLKLRNAIAKDKGPLKGLALVDLATQLVQVGMAKQDAKTCVDAVMRGQVLIAMIVPKGSEPAAVEMLKDHSAVFTKVT